ncbi:MAG: hypothetical protein HYR60_24360 [Acidobacteria bacterium]|nr:hypothetical protein [Acidobacteriota bacterium]
MLRTIVLLTLCAGLALPDDWTLPPPAAASRTLSTVDDDATDAPDVSHPAVWPPATLPEPEFGAAAFDASSCPCPPAAATPRIAGRAPPPIA